MFNFSFPENNSLSNLLEEEVDFEYSLLKKVKAPVTRFGRRLINREQLKLVKALLKIENSFVADLFNEDYCNAEYKNFYDYHLEAYILAVEYITKELKPEFFEINKHYFNQKFKPTERFKKED